MVYQPADLKVEHAVAPFQLARAGTDGMRTPAMADEFKAEERNQLHPAD